MRSQEITVTNLGTGMAEALEMTETVGAKNMLGRKEALHLRLLAEELFGMMRTIAGDISAKYWLEFFDRDFTIHLQAEIRLSKEIREKLLDISTAHENVAAKDFMGKVRDMIAVILLEEKENPSLPALGLMRFGTPDGVESDYGYDWSLNRYRTNMENSVSSEKAETAKDELEKSIVASIADEVTVSIVGSKVEITVFKSF